MKSWSDSSSYGLIALPVCVHAYNLRVWASPFSLALIIHHNLVPSYVLSRKKEKSNLPISLIGTKEGRTGNIRVMKIQISGPSSSRSQILPSSPSFSTPRLTSSGPNPSNPNRWNPNLRRHEDLQALSGVPPPAAIRRPPHQPRVGLDHGC